MQHRFHFIIIIAITISTVLNIVSSCKNNIETEKNTVNICIDGDENVKITCDNIEVKIGSKWKNIKTRVIRCIQCKKGYKIDKIVLKDMEEEVVIRSNFIFEENETIYVTSKLGRGKENEEDLPVYNEKICIEIKGDKHIEIEDDELRIEKGCTWSDIKEEIIGRLKCDAGYRFNKCKLTSSRGKTLYDDYIFKRDTSIYVMSKKEKTTQPLPQPEETVQVNLKGDENVILEYIALKVPKYVQWKDIKDTEYIQNARTKEGFYLSEWHLTDDVNSPEIEDEYKFSKETNIFVFAISNTTIPDNPPSPEEPSGDQYTEVKPPNDEIMLDIEPEKEGIKCSSIDYPLPNVVHPFAEELWQGVFSNDKIIYISPFKMAKYELTYRIWEETRKWAIGHGYTFLNDGWKGSENNEHMSDMHPVTQISWIDAIIWCNAHTEKLNGNTSACVYLNAENNLPLRDAQNIFFESTSESTTKLNLKIENRKKGFRLPTEEEWEYVARREGKKSSNTDDAGKTLFFTKLHSASGAKHEIASRKTQNANFALMTKELEATTVCQWYFNGTDYKRFYPNVFNTRPVGTKRANYLGFYDMSGNICEFSCSLTEEPIFKNDDSKDVLCIIRGGSWEDISYDCTVGRRKCRDIREASYKLGFRLCCSK